MVRVGNLVLFQTIRKTLSIFHHWGQCLLWFIMYRFYYVPSMPAFWSYHKWMLDFVKGFLCIYWDNHMVFMFQFVNVVYHIDWFAKIEESCILGIKLTWSWCMIFLICCCILFARICWGFLYLCPSVVLTCSFLFLWHLLFGFGIRVIVAS